MKYILLSILFLTYLNADLSKLTSFEANFVQTIKDEKGKELSYHGYIAALKPQLVFWKYTKPIEKDIYINSYTLTIIEPELEQVTIRNISTGFNLFQIFQNAKKTAKNRYETKIDNINYIIKTDENSTLQSISYVDEFDNTIVTVFSSQKTNQKLDTKIFTPKIPLEYDIIRG